MELWVVWLVLIVFGVAFQLHSVVHNRKWGMLTSSVRWLRVRTWGRAIIFPAWFWLTWHWFVEPTTLSNEWVDDVGAVLVGLVVALLVNYHDTHTQDA